MLGNAHNHCDPKDHHPTSHLLSDTSFRSCLCSSKSIGAQASATVITFATVVLFFPHTCHHDMSYYLTYLLGFSVIATASPLTIRPINDQCGPTVQDDPNNPIDTCVTPVTQVYHPSAYGVYADTNPISTLDRSNAPQPYVARNWYEGCASSIANACRSLAPALNGTWVFHSEGPYCQVGYYLPAIPGAARVPSEQHCLRDILTPMSEVIASVTTPYSSINRASVNINSLVPNAYPVPDGQTGVAVNSGYASWVLQAYVVSYNIAAAKQTNRSFFG